MKHFHFPTIAKALLMTVVLGSPALVSAQIFPIGTIQTNTYNAYPNPFTDLLTVQIVASNVTYLKIDLNTLQGTNVLQTSIPYAQQVQIQTGTVVPGTYQLTVYDQNEAVLFSKKVVKAPRSLRQ